MNNKLDDDLYSQKYNENEITALKNENNSLINVV